MTTAMTTHYDNAFKAGNSIVKIQNAARSVFLERDILLEYFVPTLISGRHGLLLGKPGIAKTAILRWFSEAMHLQFFWWTLDSDTVKEDLFGTNSVQALQQDRFERKWAGFAKAHIVLLDEPGKAPNAVLNMLLTALNERVGQSLYETIKFPLHSVWAGSNEAFDDNAAVWDRFHTRIPLADVTTNDNLWSVMCGDIETPISEPVDPACLESCRVVANHMRTQALNNNELKEVAMLIKAEAANMDIIPSSRRWKEVLTIAAGAAIARGSSTIEPVDLFVAPPLLWDHKEQFEKLRMSIQVLVDREKIEIEAFSKKLDEVEKKLQLAKNNSAKDKVRLIAEAAQLGLTYKYRGARWQPYVQRAENITKQYMIM